MARSPAWIGDQRLAVSSTSTTSSKSSMLIALAAGVAILYFGRQIFIPLALALVLSFLLTPLVSLLEKARLRRVPAVLLVLAVGFALTAGIGWEVAGQLIEITTHARDYKANLDDKIQSLHASGDGALGEATRTIQELNQELALAADTADHAANRRNASGRQSTPIPVQVTAPPSNLIQDSRALLGPLAVQAETGGIVVIFTAFMLIKREDLRNRLIRLGGQGQLNVMTQALDEASHRLSRYLLLQFLVNALYGVFFGLGLYAIRIPHALLWGAVAAVLRLVPYIGTLVATALPVAIALTAFPGWTHAALVFCLFLVLELTVGNVVEPWLYGAHTGISSLAILVAAVFWAMLWGPVGLILSTPLTVCLLLLGRYVPELDFLEVLLGDEPVLRPEEHFYQRLLAMDQEEARNIAEVYLQENSLVSLYESVFIPALRLAEQDRHMDALGDQKSRSIFQSTRELLEELDERFRPENDADRVIELDRSSVDQEPQFARAEVICIPARDEADELVGMMLAHLIQQSGDKARFIPIGAVNDMLETVSRSGFHMVCVSALPPFAVGQARSLCRGLRARFPDLAIVVGLWEFPGGVPMAQQRIGTACTDAVASTLSEAVLQIRRLSQSAPIEAKAKTSRTSA